MADVRMGGTTDARVAAEVFAAAAESFETAKARHAEIVRKRQLLMAQIQTLRRRIAFASLLGRLGMERWAFALAGATGIALVFGLGAVVLHIGLRTALLLVLSSFGVVLGTITLVFPGNLRPLQDRMSTAELQATLCRGSEQAARATANQLRAQYEQARRIHDGLIEEADDTPADGNRPLLRLQGSILLSNSWGQELIVFEDHVDGEVLGGSVGLKRVKMTLTYDRIAQVNLIRGIFKADLELVNTGGADNFVIKALDKGEAERAKRLIDAKIAEFRRIPGNTTASPSIADEIEKLARLNAAGKITDAEFDAAKKRLLTQ